MVNNHLIIRFKPNFKIGRFGSTFSIWFGGDFLRGKRGQRRAWSTRQAAQIAAGSA